MEGPPNLNCFPDDDGRDTVTRYVVIDRTIPDTIIYAGYRDGDVEDSLNIMFYWDFQQGAGRRKFSGLTDSCDARISGGARTWRKRIIMDSSIGYNVGNINLTLDPEKEGDFTRVSAECSYLQDTADPDSRLYFRFDGRRIR